MITTVRNVPRSRWSRRVSERLFGWKSLQTAKRDPSLRKWDMRNFAPVVHGRKVKVQVLEKVLRILGEIWLYKIPPSHPSLVTDGIMLKHCIESPNNNSFQTDLGTVVHKIEFTSAAVPTLSMILAAAWGTCWLSFPTWTCPCSSGTPGSSSLVLLARWFGTLHLGALLWPG